MKTRVNIKVKTLVKHISCDCKCSLIVQHVIQIKNGIMKYVFMSVEHILPAKKIIAGILAHEFVKILGI